MLEFFVTHEITTYALTETGRTRQFTTRGVTVQVRPHDRDDDDTAMEVTEYLATISNTMEETHLKALADLIVLRRRFEEVSARCAALETKIPPERPARLLGPGCVRFDEKGQLWLLNTAAKGWSAWGVICDGWDDLFRRYNVRVTSCSRDACGQYWVVEPCNTNT